mmetsp:Transcript_34116/g.66039  ORF Transcript_34116/g.66039 Transcript_34116/m.66039 type:complete len:356 (-) Transcript_34116:273-1340(-)
MAALGSEYATALLLNTSELFNRSSLNLPLAPLEFVANRSMNLGIREASSWITNFIYKHCVCFARCRRRKEATELQKHRVRQRQPRLLFTEAGAVRLWSDLEAELQRQCDETHTTGVQEVLVLQERPSSVIVLVLFSDRLLVAQLRNPHSQSSALAETPWTDGDPLDDLEDPEGLDEWLGDDMGRSVISRRTSRMSQIDGALAVFAIPSIRSLTFTKKLTGCDVETTSSVLSQQSDCTVPGETLWFRNLQAVSARVPERGSSTEPALLLTQDCGVERILPFGSAILGEHVDVKEVLMHLTKAVRSVIAHPGKKAHWDMLHKSLHPDEEDRWHQDDRNRTDEGDRSNRNPTLQYKTI